MFVKDRVRLGLVGASVALCLGLDGCAAQQPIPVTVFPESSEIYVDGQRVRPDKSGSIWLRKDRGHVVLVREPGYRPEQVILESIQEGAERHLRPARIAVRLAPSAHTGKAIQVGLEGEPAVDTPPAPLTEPRDVMIPAKGQIKPGSQGAGTAGGREAE